MHFQLTSSGYINTYLYGTIGAGLSGVLNVPLDGEFHLVAVTFDQSYVKTYVDGIFDAETADTGGYLPVGGEYYIGMSHDDTRFYKGDIAYVKLFNRALTAEEMKIEYNTMVNNEIQVDENGKLYATKLKEY